MHPNITIKKPIQNIFLFLLLFTIFDYGCGQVLGLFITSETLGIVTYEISDIIIIITLNHFLTQQSFHFHLGVSKSAVILTGIALGLLASIHPAKFSSIFPMFFFVAITEELMFRGVVFPSLLNICFRKERSVRSCWIAIGLSGLIFGLFHFINLTHQALLPTVAQVIEVTGMGCLLVASYLRSGNLMVPMTIHFWIDFTLSSLTGSIDDTSTQVSIVATILHLTLYLTIAALIMPKRTALIPKIEELVQPSHDTVNPVKPSVN